MTSTLINVRKHSYDTGHNLTLREAADLLVALGAATRTAGGYGFNSNPEVAASRELGISISAARFLLAAIGAITDDPKPVDPEVSGVAEALSVPTRTAELLVKSGVSAADAAEADEAAEATEADDRPELDYDRYDDAAEKAEYESNWPVIAEDESIEFTSTNGRYGLNVLVKAGVRKSTAGGVYRGKFVRLSSYAAVIEPGNDDYIVIVNSEASPRNEDAEVLMSVYLQSHAYVSVLKVGIGGVWVEYGYKRRSNRYVRFEYDGSLEVLSEVDKALVRTEWIKSKIEGMENMTMRYGDVEFNPATRRLSTGFGENEVVLGPDTDDIVEVLEGYAPLASWKVS